MKRIMTGVGLGSGWLALLFLGSFELFWLVILGAAGVALFEYFRMTLPREGAPAQVFWLSGCGLLPVLLSYFGRFDLLAVGFFAALFLLFAYLVLTYEQHARPFELICRAGFGFLYPGLAAAHLVLLWRQPQGALWLVLLTAVIVASDTGAYYIGSWLGRAKLCPAISPGKTVAGALGGLGGGILAVLVVGAYCFAESGWYRLIGLAVILVAAGIVGDLVESIIKRSSGVKDSGAWLAGHGGLLDRVDSILLAGPLLLYIIHFGMMTGGR